MRYDGGHIHTNKFDKLFDTIKILITFFIWQLYYIKIDLMNTLNSVNEFEKSSLGCRLPSSINK